MVIPRLLKEEASKNAGVAADVLLSDKDVLFLTQGCR